MASCIIDTIINFFCVVTIEIFNISRHMNESWETMFNKIPFFYVNFVLATYLPPE